MEFLDAYFKANKMAMNVPKGEFAQKLLPHNADATLVNFILADLAKEKIAVVHGDALDIPVREDLLQRPQDTIAQQELDAAARRRNLRRAFAIDAPQALAGRQVAIVDDVLTTGATAEALAGLLRRAGAARVDVYCLARTPAPG